MGVADSLNILGAYLEILSELVPTLGFRCDQGDDPGLLKGVVRLKTSCFTVFLDVLHLPGLLLCSLVGYKGGASRSWCWAGKGWPQK